MCLQSEENWRVTETVSTVKSFILGTGRVREKVSDQVKITQKVGLIVSSLLYKYIDLLEIIHSVDCFSWNLKPIPIMLLYCRSGAGWILQKPFFPWNYC